MPEFDFEFGPDVLDAAAKVVNGLAEQDADVKRQFAELDQSWGDPEASSGNSDFSEFTVGLEDPAWLKTRSVLAWAFSLICAGSVFVLLLEFTSAILSGMNYSFSPIAAYLAAGSAIFLLGLFAEPISYRLRLWLYLAGELRPLCFVAHLPAAMLKLPTRTKHWILYGWPALGQRHPPCRCWVCRGGKLYHRRCRCLRCWVRRLRPGWR